IKICSLAGVLSFVASPKGYEPPFPSDANEICITNDPSDAIKNADIVYTDVWASMGQENSKKERAEAFQNFCITPELFALAKKDAIFMHCLPAHRGEEVSADVVDGPQSVIFDQAENRLHAQKALLIKLLGS
ncbi:MAG: ornithine carbamoyltransferase, partial [Candidatus Margulisbacteria bacterium]|nr:ornithine carbamoyltransferase [Candidatus Margulisiibacteriota bacterium]